jgi:hypothetical protein
MQCRMCLRTFRCLNKVSCLLVHGDQREGKGRVEIGGLAMALPRIWWKYRVRQELREAALVRVYTTAVGLSNTGWIYPYHRNEGGVAVL